MDEEEYAMKEREHRLEVWKFYVSILTPLLLLALTFVVNNAIQDRGSRLKREEQILAEKQKIYVDLGQRLNVFYVYVTDVGDFRSYTPPEIIKLKREADRQFFAYRPYWSVNTETLYREFLGAAFATYNGSGKAAKINACKHEKVSAYRVDGLDWNPEWDSYFTETRDPRIEKRYYSLVSALLRDIVNAGVRELEPLPLLKPNDTAACPLRRP